eukprot:4731464-Karenia_brevis.AAC.1
MSRSMPLQAEAAAVERLVGNSTGSWSEDSPARLGSQGGHDENEEDGDDGDDDGRSGDDDDAGDAGAIWLLPLQAAAL